ncbi:MAG: alpha-2-macroglobulin family protein [Pseudomonadota bacterium]
MSRHTNPFRVQNNLQKVVGSIGYAIILGLALVSFVGASAVAQNAPRSQFELFDDTDFFGGDLRTIKEITLQACQTACADDQACRAFTYNVRARWCFLKSADVERKTFEGAISGLVVRTGGGSLDELGGAALGPAPALAYVPRYQAQEARTLSRNLARAARDVPPTQLDEFTRGAQDALSRGDPMLAASLLAQAAGLDANRAEIWIALSESSLAASRAGQNVDYDMQRQAISAALNGYQQSRSTQARARALGALARALEASNQSRPALEAYKGSLALTDDRDVARRFAALRETSGFRIVNHRIDSDTETPRACVEFSEAIDETVDDYRPYLRIDGAAPEDLTAEGQQVCIGGLAHGQRYRVQVNEGLPSSVNEPLLATVTLDLYVRDRSPSVRFTGDRYVLPTGMRPTIPVVSVNTTTVDLSLYRLPERAVAERIRSGNFGGQLYGYERQQLGEELGVAIWSGTLSVETELNREVITGIPVEGMDGLAEPGLYVMVARPKNDSGDSWGPQATQWLVISDIGLSGIQGTHGMTVMTRSLGSAEPLEGLTVDLISRDNAVLGSVETDSNGFAIFASGLLRGTGGAEPTVLLARDAQGGFVFLDLNRAGFDFSDRGVEGRDAPGPVDVFGWTERGIYRPGETIHASALARVAADVTAVDLPMTFVVTRPDGMEDGRTVSTTPLHGGHTVAIGLPENAMQGAWRIAVHVDTDAPALAEMRVLVEDFLPERLALDLTADDGPVDSDAAFEITANGRFLYGAPAARLTLEGTVSAIPVREWSAAEGYVFGLVEEDGTGRTVIDLSDLPVLSDDGTAEIVSGLPPLPATTQLLEARATLRLREPGGRAVEESLTRAIAPQTAVIGIDPLFDGNAVNENSVAGFRVAGFAPDGSASALGAQPWKLERIERQYQWYRADDRWRYEPADFTTQIADGTLSLAGDGPAQLDLPVAWGRYRLTVGGDGPTDPVTSVQFDAGWFVAASATDTPDGLEIALDRDSYGPGDKARLKVSPRFAGELILTLGADGVVETRSTTLSQSVVDAGGTEFEIPVSADWGAGVYVTATLIRPGNAQDSRMPMRAIGIQWLTVDPGSRALSVNLGAPALSRPNGPLVVPVSVEGGANRETYVTVAAVDAGILSLTDYQPPEPADWYFGQRRLGLEYRDLYGRLIDGSQGALGRLRTGGDGPGMRSEGNPPTGPLVAFFSGPVLLDGDGRTEISFDMPAFNGTVRLMAVAWSDNAVGQGTQDVIVRDPVVLTANVPRFLAPGDSTSLRLDIANTEGPGGDYAMRIDNGPALAAAVRVGDRPASIALPADGRATLSIPLEAKKPGDSTIAVSLSHPSGIEVTQEVAIQVRSGAMPVTRRYELDLAADGGAVTLGPELLNDIELLGASVTIDAARVRGFNTASLLMQLDRYPLGCVEQTASRALPLLYLSSLQTDAGLGDDAKISGRIDKAIRRVLAHQNGSGGFGLWGPNGSGDLWLDAYIGDFLTRAREQGFTVPDTAMRLVIDNLRNRIAYAAPDQRAENGVAYALYVLARNRRISIGDLRFYADAKINAFASPMERAQIAASLALYGDAERANALFENALAVADNTEPPDPRQRQDYGSVLRDGAALLALAGETRPSPAVLPRISRHVTDAYASATTLSTQEQLWLVLAARALQQDSGGLSFDVDGKAHQGQLSRRFSGGALSASPVRIVNRAGEQVAATVTVTGAPATLPPAENNGLGIRRAVYTLQGQSIDPSTMAQNDRAVVVLTITPQDPAFARLAVTDLLPAGLEIDNPRIVESAQLEAFDWLPDTLPVHAEFRSDRFVAAFDRTAQQEGPISVAYVVRAVRPGDFTAPGAFVEDMYRPTRNGRSASGRLSIAEAN